MSAKLGYLYAITVLLVALTVLIIILHANSVPALAETMIGGLLTWGGVAIHATFKDSTNPTKPPSGGEEH